jgi:hypothetical protein
MTQEELRQIIHDEVTLAIKELDLLGSIHLHLHVQDLAEQGLHLKEAAEALYTILEKRVLEKLINLAASSSD